MKTVVICMLRGVNVGGHNMIRMDALKALCESLGLLNVQTYVQSGNVIFATQEDDLDQLALAICDAIEQRCGFRCDVILRTLAELREVIRRNPFAARQDIVPSKLLVTFLARHPDQEARDKVLAMKIGPEELRLGAREYYVYFPDGAGQSKLPAAAIARALKEQGTARNWNSITKMCEIARCLEGS